MRKTTKSAIDRLSAYGYTVKHITSNLVLVRKYPKHCKVWKRHLPLYRLYRVEVAE